MEREFKTISLAPLPAVLAYEFTMKHSHIVLVITKDAETAHVIQVVSQGFRYAFSYFQEQRP